MVNTAKKPFYLNEEQQAWVENTLASMSLEEKAAQTICIVGFERTDQELLSMYREMPYGGIMHRPGISTEIKERNEMLQKAVKVPLLIAANMEFGGGGVMMDGTYYGAQLAVAATADSENARHLGEICGKEASSIGVNYAFAPVVDIDVNWRNPITNTRTYGADPEMVRSCGSKYMEGIRPYNVAVSIKHFPGDGIDERDQHTLPSVNSLSCEEWDATYGKVYQTLIDEGAQTVMAGHIMQPAYTRYFNPEAVDADQQPATLSKELITDLLKGKMGFNGMVITDAANMGGYMSTMGRRDQVIQTFNAGCDMFLFGKNVFEDFGYIMDGVRSGELPLERLDDAVRRILALKASLGLHQGAPVLGEDYKTVVSCEEHLALARECADRSITLVKDTQKLLPLDPQVHKRVLLHVLEDEGMIGGKAISKAPMICRLLEEAGFQVDYFGPEKHTMKETMRAVSDLKASYDVIMYFANVANASYKTTARIRWSDPAGINAPYLTRDIPTLFVSLANPYHFVDVPMIRTIINSYSSDETYVKATVDKIIGKSEFKGVSPVDPFCGFFGKDL